MSGRGGGGAEQRGRSGGQGKGKSGDRGGHKQNYRRKTHTSNTPEIKDDIFNCGRTEHTALFEKSKRAIVSYIRRTGGEESALISAGMETMTTPTIVEPAEPVLVEDPANMGQNPPVMIENRREMIKWEAQLKMIPKRDHALQTGRQKIAIWREV